jgi:hypothetical protein
MAKILTEQTLQEIAYRIVEVAHPRQVILLGSAVRGERKALVEKEQSVWRNHPDKARR